MKQQLCGNSNNNSRSLDVWKTLHTKTSVTVTCSRGGSSSRRRKCEPGSAAGSLEQIERFNRRLDLREEGANANFIAPRPSPWKIHLQFCPGFQQQHKQLKSKRCV